MAAPDWNISGQYCETCSCDFVCPCILGQMAARPSKGSCTFAMTLQIERGSYGHIALEMPDVAKACAEAGVRLGIAYHMRWHRGHRTLAAMVASHASGDVGRYAVRSAMSASCSEVG